MTGAASEINADANRAVAGKWTGRTRGGIVGNWIFVALVRTLGLGSAYALLAVVSFYYLFFAPRALRATLDYRRRLGLGGSAFARYGWAWRHFYTFGQILLDRVAIMTGAADKFRFEFDGREHLLDAINEGKGVIVVTAHCGSWAAAAHLLGGTGVRVNIVAYEGEAEHIRRLFERTFEGKAFSVIQIDGSAETILAVNAALARGEIVAMNGDRAVGARCVTLPFLGAPVAFPAGPYMVAALTGAPVVHNFMMRDGAYRYRFHTFPAEHPSFDGRESRDELIRKWAASFVSHLEEMVRRYPMQWQNFYDFWGADAKE